jgi:LasA protease
MTNALRTDTWHRLAVVLAVLTAGMALSATPASAVPRRSGNGALLRAVRADAAHRAKGARDASFRASVIRRKGSWAYGDVVMLPARPKHDEGVGIPATFLAHLAGRGRAAKWRVALQGTSAFIHDLKISPRSLVPSVVRKLDLAGQTSAVRLGGSGPAAEPQFSLPWGVGETWHLWYGPHNTDNDFGPHPYTSLDFSGGDHTVRAAANGLVYRPCPNLVVIDHGGGWETGYYHMPNIFVHTGQFVHTGEPLGTIGTATGCGGYANGAHVHFSIYHFRSSGVYNVFQSPSADMNLDVIGGWVVHDGSRSGLGFMQRLTDGHIVYPSDTRGNGDIYNSGIAGGGKTTIPTGYVTLANVTIESGPGTTYSTVGSLPNGSSVAIACQLKGGPVNGSSVWDEIDPGKYISDSYVSTPVVNEFTPGIPQCSTGPAPGGGGGTGGGGGAPGATATAPPNGAGTANSTAGLPRLDSGAHDTSFENTTPWSSLNGNTNQQFACGTGTAYNGGCYLNVSTPDVNGSFIEDFAASPPTGECYTLGAWLRARSGGPNVNGNLDIFALNAKHDLGAGAPFTATATWQRFLVTLRVPSPTDATPWSSLRGQLYLTSTGAVLNWDLTQWYGPYKC